MEQDEGKEGNNLQLFIKKVHDAKIEAEIKMRRELNKRICYCKLEKLTQIYGNNFAVRLKAYARFFVEIDRLEQEEAK